jgi:hypothetical protein
MELRVWHRFFIVLHHISKHIIVVIFILSGPLKVRHIVIDLRKHGIEHINLHLIITKREEDPGGVGDEDSRERDERDKLQKHRQK